MTYKRWILILLISLGLLVGCSSQTPAVTPIMTAPASTSVPILKRSGGGVTASGVVVPAQQANLGLALPARIKSLEVIEGEKVDKGQILVQTTGHAGLVAAVSAAEFELISAQQTAGIALAQAKLDWANALDALDDAERQWTANQLGNRASPTGIKDAKADVTIAEKRYSQAQNNLDKASGTSSKAQAQNALTDARKAYNQAVWLLNWLQSEPTDLEQALLDADLEMAKAMLKNAEGELERLEGGSDADALSLAEARLKAAESGLAAAKSALADSELQAPFTGIIAGVMVNPGEVVVPGQVLITMADLDHFQVETTDLSERDVDQVKVGGAAKVHLEALGEEVEGQVSNISLQSTTIGGDVVYTVTIDLLTHPPELLWGMSVEVEISTD